MLSLLLELRKDALPESHMGLFPFLLSAAPWERQGNKKQRPIVSSSKFPTSVLLTICVHTAYIFFNL